MFLITYTIVINRVTENSVSTIKFYRVFLKIYERRSEDIYFKRDKKVIKTFTISTITYYFKK